MNRRGIGIVLMICMIAVMFAGLFLFNTAKSSADAPVLLDRQETGLRYRIGVPDDKSLRIEVEYDTASANGVLGYKQAAAKRSEQYATTHINQNFVADITFNRPMAVQQFQDLLKNYNLRLVDFGVRTIEPSGQRGIMAGTADKDGNLDIDGLNQMLTHRSELKVSGVIHFRTMLSGATYPKLAADNNVFLVDALESQMKDETAALRPSVSRDSIGYTALNPYWYMEDLGLVQK